jgi:hypothetical protein
MLLHWAKQHVFLKVGVLVKKEMRLIKSNNYSFLDKSLYYIFKNFYNKNVPIVSYGGFTFNYITGFAQVVINGIPMVYVVDAYTTLTSRAVVFNQLWGYQTYYILLKLVTFALLINRKRWFLLHCG